MLNILVLLVAIPPQVSSINTNTKTSTNLPPQVSYIDPCCDGSCTPDKVVKTCGCSSQCTCGCNEGEICRCASNVVNTPNYTYTQPTVTSTTHYVQPMRQRTHLPTYTPTHTSTPTFTPVRTPMYTPIPTLTSHLPTFNYFQPQRMYTPPIIPRPTLMHYQPQYTNTVSSYRSC